MDNLDTRSLLVVDDNDRIASVVANLLEEVVTLSERIAVLEGEKNVDEADDRINAIIDRVLSPLS